MSVKCYCGVMGSGKTYEVVTVVIYGALALGRRVVSNIAGLDIDAMTAALQAEGVEKIGELVHVQHEDVKKSDFWLADTGEPATIKPGDLVVLDEVWRFWDGLGPGARDDKRPAQVMNFLRMHRQFPHPETGVTCDLVLITQDVMDLHRSVRAVVEETYYMRKLIQVGKPDSYRVDIYTSGKVTGKPLRQLFNRYDPAKFGFYKSHAKASGSCDPRELNADDRGNLLKSKYFKVLIYAVPLLLLLGALVVYVSYRALGNSNDKHDRDKPDVKQSAASSGQKTAPLNDKANVSQWQVVGVVTGDKGMRVLLKSEQGMRWLDGPSGVKRTAVTTEVILPDGSFAVSWPGGK